MTRHLQLDYLTANGTLDLPDGRRAFFKLSSARPDARAAVLRRRTARERAALRALAGLAVPELYPVDPTQIPLLAGGALTAGEPALVVESFEGTPIHDHTGRNSAARLVGVWLFCLEQLVAFRRRRVLYTDVKCANIVARSSPHRVVIVDFDRVIPLVGRPSWESFGATPGSDPPELATSAGASEASCVYQVAILLLHFITSGDNRTLHDHRLGLGRFAAVMDRIGAPEMPSLLRRCLADRAGRRPRDYEALLADVRELALPAPSLRTWRQLRSHHEDSLNGVGLRADPGGG